MPNDAKLGLVAGMAMVVLIAMIFFRKDPAAAQPMSTVFPAPNAVAPDAPPMPKTPPSDNAVPALPPPMLPDP
jgi:hypothetical protein